MKKSLIAGAGVAALAFAALPFAGVFAENVVKDNITVNIAESCELGIVPTGVGGDNANNYYGTGAAGELITINAGTKTTSGTATTITVKCNDANGYTITAGFTSLAGPGDSFAYSASPEASAGSGTWTAYAGSTAINPTNGLTGGSTMTDSYTFSYKAGADADQAAGDYTGTATYTLNAN